jgi:hypothetical protein
MYPAANATVAPYNKRFGRRRGSTGASQTKVTIYSITMPAMAAPIALAILDAGNGRELDARINMLAITTTNAKIVKLFSSSNVAIAKIRAATAGVSHLIVALEKSTEPRVIIVRTMNKM